MSHQIGATPEVVSVQEDAPEQAPVAVYGISGAISCKGNGFAFEVRFGEGAGLAPKTLDRLGGVFRLRGVHADEPDGVILPLMADPDGVAVNHPFHAGRDGIKLSARDERSESGDQNGKADQLAFGVHLHGQISGSSIL